MGFFWCGGCCLYDCGVYMRRGGEFFVVMECDGGVL